ncbi:MAG: fibronectin type III domain-containing protein, partial [Planctomycetota bacterium]
MLMLMTVSLPLSAADVTLNWTAPTTNTDGSPLTDLGGYKIYYGPTSGNYTNNQDLPDPAASSATVTDLTAGTWYFAVTAYNSTGQESDFSNEASKDILLTPSPPGSLTVANLTAFTIVKQENRFVLVAVGTVPPDTPCDGSQSVNGHYVVDRSVVTW